MTIGEICAVIILVSALTFLIMKLIDVLVMPIRIGKTSRLEAVLHISGNAPELEDTVKKLLFLSNSGKMRMNLVIVDEGMDRDTRKTAELLIKDSEEIRFGAANMPGSESCDGEGLQRDKRSCRDSHIPK